LLMQMHMLVWGTWRMDVHGVACVPVPVKLLPPTPSGPPTGLASLMMRTPLGRVVVSVSGAPVGCTYGGTSATPARDVSRGVSIRLLPPLEGGSHEGNCVRPRHA
jgi:hypothetical protein